MIVCHCHGISDRHVRRAVRSGAVTPDGIAAACGAGTSCGGCGPLLDEILSGELDAQHRDAAAALDATPAR